MRGVPFDIETYIHSVESYVSGSKTVDDIVRETGMSESTLFNRLRELLSIALNGSGAFRRFKDVLSSFPEARKHLVRFQVREDEAAG